ncbi:MAG: hypothetical protein U1E16_08535 [Hyphomicrobiales bacterium]
MRTALWLSSFCLWPIAALAAENTSVYTPFDLDRSCLRVQQGDGMTFAGTWKCAGFGGNDIAVSIDDERSHVGFGPKPTETCAYAKTFSRFNTALSPVEWRLRDGKPFAAIERWRVVTDDDGSTVTWLVISKIEGTEACPVHYIAGSYPNANEHAREAADALASEDYDCEHDTPTVDSRVGAEGIAFVSCAEAKGE